MPTYRVYFLDKAAHISSPPTIMDCACDEDAQQQVRQYIEDKDAELWQGGALIANFAARPGVTGHQFSLAAIMFIALMFLTISVVNVYMQNSPRQAGEAEERTRTIELGGDTFTASR